MADNILVDEGADKPVATEEVSTLNGNAQSPAVHVQRTAPTLITANGVAVDAPGDATYGVDVDITRSALPTGAATSAKQSDGSQKTQIVDGAGAVVGTTSNALDVNVKSGVALSGSVEVSNDAGNPLPVSAASLPLPSGAASAANQATVISGIATLIGHVDNVESSLSSLVTELGQKTEPADQQHTIVDSSALPSGAATSAKQDTIIGHIDGVETLLTAIDGHVDGLETTNNAISTKLTDASQKSQLVDGSGNVVGSTANALDVNIKSGGPTQYTEDVAAAADPVGKALMLVRDDARAGSVTNANGDNVAARGTNAGEIYVKHVDSIPVTDNGGSLTVDGSVSVTGNVEITNDVGNPLPVSGTVTETNSNAIAASLSVLDDWDESDRLKANLISGQAGISAGAGAVAANTPRTTLASDDPAVTALQIMDDWDANDRAKVSPISGQDGVAGGSGLVSAATQRVVLATDVALPAGTNAIGKLAANSGVDIGDTDVTSVIAGTGATNLGKAVDAAAGATDTGVAVLAVRDDATSTLGPVDGDYTNLRTNARGALWVDMETRLDSAIDSVAIGTSVTPGTGATNLGKAEDAAHTSGDVGVMALSVRQNTAAATSGTDGDYQPLITDTNGRLHTVEANSAAALTALQLIDDPVLTDDAAFTPATSKVMMAGFEADESSTDSVDEGDGGAARMTLDRKQIVNPQPHTQGGLSTYHLVSAASTNANVVKASAGQLYGWFIYNSNAAARKLVFHNTASTPTAGSSVFFSLVIPAGSAANVFSPFGIEFSSGIAITAVTGLADSDNTGVGSTDLIINLWYK